MHGSAGSYRRWHTASVEAVLAGLALGFGSGVSPGPLLALAIAVTLRRGLRSGLAVATAPLITDTLIILLALTLVRQLPTTVVAYLSLAGCVVVGWFAWENISAARTANVDQLRPTSIDQTTNVARITTTWLQHPLAQATFVNLTNPAPWLFWITAGAPLLVTFANRSISLAFAYLACFYLAIVGSKAILVIATSKGRHRLSNRGYAGILLSIGVLMIFVAAGLFISAMRSLISG